MKLKIIILLFLFSIKSFGQNQLDVFFDFNEDVPNEVSVQKLNQWILESKAIEIKQIQGFCDSVDTKNYNKKLAERRINNVLEILKNGNIKINPNLETLAFGKDFKQSKIQSENRKVAIFYSEIKNDEDDKPLVSSNFTEKIKNSKVGEIITLPNIYFYNNSARIVPKSKPTLYELLCAMQDYPKLKIEIQGHICCQISKDINDVSTARAKSIYYFLIQNKIDRKRMKYKGYGVTKPIHKIPEKNFQEEDENRRVEILILEN